MTASDQQSDASQSLFASKYRTLTIGIMALITITAFEASAVITAMPVAARDLDALTWYAWTFTAFVASSLFAMVVAGETADRRGPVLPIAVGLALFAAGSLIAGIAPSMGVLLFGRAIQGLGSGAQIVAVYVLIGQTYPDALRPRVFTAVSGAWIVPGIAGPVLAGVMADRIGWRSVFLAVLALVIPIALVLIPRLRALQLHGDPSATPSRMRMWLALVAAVSLGALQAAGQLFNLAGLMLAIPALLLLVVSTPKLLPAGTFSLTRGLPTVVMMRGLMAGAFFGAETFIPLMLVNERNLATAAAGAALSGAVIGWFIGSWYQGRPSTTTPRWKLLRVGSAVVTLGIVATSVALLPQVPPLVVVLTWGAGAFGMGMLYATLGVLLLQLSPPEEQGFNSAALQVSDSIGVVVFTGLAGVIFAAGHTKAGQDGLVFLAIYLAMAAVSACGTAIAPRVQPVQIVELGR